MHAKKLFPLLLCFVVVLFQTIVPNVGKADELNNTMLIDSAQITKTDLTYGEQTGVRVTFSEKPNLKLKSGDTITMTLPPELRGFNVNIKLDDYGSCNVTGEQVVCTFNSKVDERKNIKGFFEFTIQATNVESGSSKTINTNFGTSLSKQAVKITHPASSGSSPGIFFYKTGDIQPNNSDEVRWFLNFNLKKEYLDSDIVLQDTSKGGQQIQKDSFYIQTSGHLGDRQFTPDEFYRNGLGYVSITSDNSFNVVIYRGYASGSSFTVGYKTTITAQGINEEYLKNGYDLNYKVNNQQPVHEQKEAQVKNISANGGAVGDLPAKGTLRILKYIDDHKEQVIPGVQFKVFTSGGQQIGDFTTNDKGIVEVPNLKAGEYYVQEVSAPEYVTFDASKKIPFTIDEDAAKGIELPISNSLKKTSIEGTKTWSNDREQDRPSEIKVDLLKDGEVIVTKTVTADNGWKYQFDQLDQYTVEGKEIQYAVKEQSVEGYESKVNGYDILNTKIEKPVDPSEKPVDPSEKPVDPSEKPVDPSEKPVDPSEKPVDPSEKPVDPSEKPVDPSEKPVDPSEKPVDPSEKPVDPSEKPVDPSEKPVDPSEKPVEPSEKPVDPSEKPVDPSEKPVDPSEKPVEPSEKPVDPSEKPVDPSEKPVEPSEKPVEPSEKPVEPSEKPVDPSEKPVEPSEKPVVPSEKPVVPSEKPVEPSEKPVVPSEKPVEPSEKPVVPSEKPVEPSEKPVAPSEKPVDPSEKPVDPSEKPVVPSEKPVEPSEKPVAPSEKVVEPSEKPMAPGEKPVEPSEKPVEQSEKTKDSEDAGKVEEEQITPEKPEQSVEQSKKPKDSGNTAKEVEKPSVEEHVNNVVQNQKVDQEEQQTPNKAERLPQTGESNTTLYQVLGLILVALACLLLRRSRKEI
ncbi:Cna B-type domain-containing protein [Lysinibacillus sp. RS11]|uniref:Cna B-type domain-containing protein n=1 Tax=Lysinibacillus sp. RS11 TaxID=3242682 RepID=UPI0035C789C3